ncbi:MAG: FCD domain-containing protein [Gallionella sp.]|jgi:DNA-binding GntR family transcriptional regulator|nr:FCD domain-containing protein [Gallionella sp.]
MTVTKIEPLVERASRTEQVYLALREALLSGVFAPGDHLSEAAVAEQLNVSKTPVREAMSSLRAKGLLIPGPKRGILVARIDARTLEEIHRVRAILEPEAVRLAVLSFDSALVERAQRLLDEAARHGARQDFGALSQSNRDFHELLYEACPNKTMKSLLNDMRDQLQFAAVSGWRGTTASWEYERSEHLAILDAASKGEAERAAELCKTHIERAMPTILSGPRSVEGLSEQ